MGVKSVLVRILIDKNLGDISSKFCRKAALCATKCLRITLVENQHLR